MLYLQRRARSWLDFLLLGEAHVASYFRSGYSRAAAKSSVRMYAAQGRQFEFAEHKAGPVCTNFTSADTPFF